MEYAEPIAARVRGGWLEEDHPGYPAFVAGTWNGWAIPLVSREVAQQIVNDQGNLNPEVDPQLHWDGDEIVVSYPDDQGEEEDRISPRDDGRYGLGLGWCWEMELEDGEDPAMPTKEQRETFTKLLDQLPRFPERGKLISTSPEAIVEPDGTHGFRLFLLTKVDGRSFETEECGRIRIARDGSVTAGEPSDD